MLVFYKLPGRVHRWLGGSTTDSGVLRYSRECLRGSSPGPSSRSSSSISCFAFVANCGGVFGGSTTDSGLLVSAKLVLLFHRIIHAPPATATIVRTGVAKIATTTPTTPIATSRESAQVEELCLSQCKSPPQSEGGAPARRLSPRRPDYSVPGISRSSRS